MLSFCDNVKLLINAYSYLIFKFDMPNSSKTTIEPILIESPSLPADAAVIWLHGLGADGHDFEPIVSELGLSENHSIRFIFPHAPIQSVTINGGMEMRSWYDIRSLDLLNDFDVSGVARSAQMVASLIDQQIQSGILPDRIVLAGFSQGGLIALHAGLTYPQPLAGIMALSTYCPTGESFQERSEMPILMMHGQQDSVIPIEVAEWSKQMLLQNGYSVEWHTYSMQHQVIPSQIQRIGQWLKARLIR